VKFAHTSTRGKLAYYPAISNRNAYIQDIGKKEPRRTSQAGLSGGRQGRKAAPLEVTVNLDHALQDSTMTQRHRRKQWQPMPATRT